MSHLLIWRITDSTISVTWYHVESRLRGGDTAFDKETFPRWFTADQDEEAEDRLMQSINIVELPA